MGARLILGHYGNVEAARVAECRPTKVDLAARAGNPVTHVKQPSGKKTVMSFKLFFRRPEPIYPASEFGRSNRVLLAACEWKFARRPKGNRPSPKEIPCAKKTSFEFNPCRQISAPPTRTRPGTKIDE